MNPVCFRFDGLTIRWYGVMLALAFLTGLVVWLRLGRKERRDLTFCSDLLFWIMVSGIVGGRVAYVFSDFRRFLSEPLEIVRVDRGGLIYYGGFLGAAAALWGFARARRERLLGLTDFVVVPLPLGHALGRIGCLLNGCCFGKPWDGPFAITYPAKSDPWYAHLYAEKVIYSSSRSLPVHPVQLYEAAWNTLLFLVLLRAYPRRRRDGSVTALYLLGYAAARFSLEFLRGDPRTVWAGLTVAQWVSLALFGGGAALWLVTRAGAGRRTT